jgi:hypothetical protein
MNAVTRTLLACSSLAAAILVGSPTFARTPTPTATLTVTVTPFPTPCPSATPTVSPEQLSEFSGEVWIDAPYYPRAAVTARIDGNVCSVPAYIPPSTCGGPPPVTPPSDPGPHTTSFALSVLSTSAKLGCGYEGAPVAFFIGDTQANQTAVWHAGTSQNVNLNIGPPFAFFQGEFTLTFHPDEPIGVRGPAGMVALIGHNVCGRATRGLWKGRDPQGREFFPYSVIVYSNEQRPGCGVEGDQVILNLVWRGGEGDVSSGKTVAVAREKGVWHAWNGTPPEINLTMDPVGIQLASVGDGASRDRGASAWAELSVGLSAFGLVGIAIAAAMRRKAATR